MSININEKLKVTEKYTDSNTENNTTNNSSNSRLGQENISS